MDLDWNDFKDHTELQKVYDPKMRRVVYDELPTLSIKKFKKDITSILSEDIASSYFGSGSAMRVTRLSIWSSLGGVFNIMDERGTIQEARPGSSSEYFLGGSPKEPIFAAIGNFRIAHVGTLSAGTVSVSFEGYLHNAEVGFPHRNAR